MGLRYPTSRCKSLPELEDRVRELVRQLEPVVLENRVIETTETIVAHGLGEVPGWIGWDPPHCVAIIRQTRAADHRNIYLQATNRCVINVRVLRAGPLLAGQMPNGGFTLPDWFPGVTDHRQLTHKNDRVEGVGQHNDDTIDLTDAATMAGNLAGLVTVRQAMAVLDAITPLATIPSVMPAHAHDQARWLLDEGRSYTFQPSNTGHTAGDLSIGGGTAFQGVPGLRGAYCVRMMTDARMLSAAGLFEYQTFTVSYWLRMETLPLLPNPIMGIVKLSNPGVFTTPYYSVGLALNDAGVTARILKGVSPRAYVDIATLPDLSQFKLYEWMHLALTWDGSYLILYVNGREIGRSELQSGVTIKYDGHGEWCVGHPPGQASLTNYEIQDIRINDTALSATYLEEVWRRGATVHSTVRADEGAEALDTGFYDVTISDGGISGFTNHRTLRVSGGGPLVGIDADGLGNGEPITLSFISDTEVTGMGSTGLVPIQGPWDQGSYLSSFTVPANEEIELRYISDDGTPFFKFTRGSAL